MRKLCAKWMTREITFDQKQQRADDSGQCSALKRMPAGNKYASDEEVIAVNEAYFEEKGQIVQ